MDVSVSAAESAHLKPLEIADWPDHLCERYDNIALISDPRHLKDFDRSGDSTLIVTSNWLQWQLLSKDGWHCVYIEQGYEPPEDAVNLSTDILLRGNDWVYLDGEDATVFESNSLGRGFSTPAALFIATYVRLSVSLSNIVDRFQPKTLIYLDLVLLDTESTSPWCRRYVAETVSEKFGLGFVDRTDPVSYADTDVTRSDWRQVMRKRCRGTLVAVYAASVGTLSQIVARFTRPRRRVLIMMAWNFFEPIAFGAHPGTQAVVHASAFPKSLRTIAKLFRHGFLLGSSPRASLTGAERNHVDQICKKLKSHWQSQPADETGTALREFARREILDNGRLHQMAGEMKSARAFLKRYRPSRLVVDGIKNLPPYPYVEVCAEAGIPVDYIWHAPVAPQNLKFDALGSDPRAPVRVDRILSWGPVNEAWLKRTGARVGELLTVGNPILGKYGKREAPSPNLGANPERRSALVVQQTTVFTDLSASLSRQFYQFVHATRELKRQGYKRVTFKLHPGISRGVEIFSAIESAFDLGCDIHRYGKFDRFVRDADVVVGPLVSGSALETASYGSRFIPVFLRPTSLDETYYSEIENIQFRLDDIGPALSENRYLDNERYVEAFGGAMTSDERTASFWDAFAR